MKKITTYTIMKYDTLDRPYGQIGKKFLTEKEADKVIEIAEKEDARRGEQGVYYYLKGSKQMEICESMEEYLEQVAKSFMDVEEFRILMTAKANENESGLN